jgi:hypothetical protein
LDPIKRLNYKLKSRLTKEKLTERLMLRNKIYVLNVSLDPSFISKQLLPLVLFCMYLDTSFIVPSS